jgi:hypothetical protein
MSGSKRRARHGGGGSRAGILEPLSDAAPHHTTALPTLHKPSLFFHKFFGQIGERSPPVPPIRAILMTASVAFAVVAVLTLPRMFNATLYASVFVPSFCGSAVLAGFPDAPFSPPLPLSPKVTVLNSHRDAASGYNHALNFQLRLEVQITGSGESRALAESHGLVLIVRRSSQFVDMSTVRLSA